MASYLFAICAILLCLGHASAEGEPFAPQRQYAVQVDGLEMIDFISPSLAYISNLRYDPLEKLFVDKPRIWFMADKSSPNIFAAQFDPAGGPHSFFSPTTSPIPISQASPYVSFAAHDNFTVGAAMVSNLTSSKFGQTTWGITMQVANIPYGQYAAGVGQTGYPEYYFYGVALTRKEGKLVAYLTGIADYKSTVVPQMNNHGIVAAEVFINETGLEVNIDWSKGIIKDTQIDARDCWDTFSATFKPEIFIDEKFILLAYPGRCAVIVKLTFPANESFASCTVQKIVPVDLESQYVSSYTYNKEDKLLYYSVKPFGSTKVILNVLDANTFAPAGTAYSFIVGRADPILTFGLTLGHAVQRLLFITAPGEEYIMRMVLNYRGLFQNDTSYATVDETYGTQISTGLYIQPYFYFATYEPNAILARANSSAFCKTRCPKNSYCASESCHCRTGWTQVVRSDGKIDCVSAQIGTTERILIATTISSTVLGILLGVSLLFASVGWYFWWRAKNMDYASL